MRSTRSARGPDHSNIERRSSTRFRLELPVRYAVSGCDDVADVGTGQTIDLSSSGLKFTADRVPATGQRIVAYIEWPALLDGSVKLQLVIAGSVVRSHGAEIALEIERHEFRTRSAAQLPPEESVR